jgi:phytoene desaturase
MMTKKVGIIGAGFSSLSAACHLAKAGYEVSIFEKNNQPGGRARRFEKEGFTFDMGPTWYWMPDVFERFFNQFDKKVSDYYELVRLNPSYRLYFGKNDFIDIPENVEELCQIFEKIEKGSGKKLKAFLKDAAYKYEVGVNNLVYKPGLSVIELLDLKLIIDAFRLNVFNSFYSFVRKYFTNPKLLQIVEFPILFLGAMPEKIPALYSLMNYADIELGTWYPKGGMHEIGKGMEKLAKELGVTFHYEAEISKITHQHNQVKGLIVNNEERFFDIIIGGADYHHVEQLLEPEKRNYSEKYWKNRTMAPSSLIFYIGVNKKLQNLAHHTLFCDEDLRIHAKEIYETPSWPTAPLFYTCCTSKNDQTAPEEKENLYILMPLAPGIEDTPEIRKTYFDLIINRIETIAEEPLKNDILFWESYCIQDFVKDYHSYKGNAYGLANTLMQTANLKPKLKSNKLKNLYFSGQLTVPGPGIPPSIISGNVVANVIKKEVPNG